MDEKEESRYYSYLAKVLKAVNPTEYKKLWEKELEDVDPTEYKKLWQEEEEEEEEEEKKKKQWGVEISRGNIVTAGEFEEDERSWLRIIENIKKDSSYIFEIIDSVHTGHLVEKLLLSIDDKLSIDDRLSVDNRPGVGDWKEEAKTWLRKTENIQKDLSYHSQHTRDLVEESNVVYFHQKQCRCDDFRLAKAKKKEKLLQDQKKEILKILTRKPESKKFLIKKKEKPKKLKDRPERSFRYLSSEEIKIKSQTFHIKYEENLSTTTKLLLNSFQNKYLYYVIDDILYSFKSNPREQNKVLAILYSPVLSLQNNQSINFFDVWIDKIYISKEKKINKFLSAKDPNFGSVSYITIKFLYKTTTLVKKQELLW